MQVQTISIKGMVCNRCIMTVKSELLDLGHTPLNLALGKATFIKNRSSDADPLSERLYALGFSVLEDPKRKLVEKVKTLVDEVFGGNFDFPERFRFSELASKHIERSYEAISDIFIATEKKSIEQYIIQYRINKTREFLLYSDLTLADIAFKLNFNSASHLSSQFKQYTGLTPSQVRQQKQELVYNSDHNYKV